MKISSRLREHFRDNRIQYIVVMVFFVLGLIMGNFKVGSLDGAVRERLLQMLDAYFGGQEVGATGLGVFVSAALNQIRAILVIWILGLTVIGIPLILLVVFMRGFSLGFTVGFLLQEKAGAGAFLSLISLLPQNLIYVPLLAVVAVVAINFSLYILQRHSHAKAPLGVSLLGYSVLMGLMMIAFGLGAFVEAYLVPWLLQLFIK